MMFGCPWKCYQIGLSFSNHVLKVDVTHLLQVTSCMANLFSSIFGEVLHSLCMISPALGYRTGGNNWISLCLIPDHSPSIFGCYLSPLSQFPLHSSPKPLGYSFIYSFTHLAKLLRSISPKSWPLPITLMAWQSLSPFSSPGHRLPHTHSGMNCFERYSIPRTKGPPGISCSLELSVTH